MNPGDKRQRAIRRAQPVRRLRAARWVAGLAALGLAACSGGREPAVSRATFVVAVPAGVSAPLHVLSIDEYTFSILSNVFEPLVDLDRDLRLVPSLAQSWVTLSDARTWSFELRPGQRFHDGSPVTAKDVVASLETARSHPESMVRPDLAYVESLRAVGDSTVHVTTRDPDPMLPNRLAPISIQRPAPASPNGYVGTGPFRLVAWERNGEVRLEAFAGHAGVRPGVERVRFRVVPGEAERLALLAAGEVDLVTDVSPDRTLDGVVPVSRYGLQVFFLVMDSARQRTPYVSHPRNPFRDVRVRRAVAHAVDRQALVTRALGGHGQVMDQIVAPEVFGFRPGLAPIEHDTARARELMRAAGFARGFDVVLDLIAADRSADSPVVRQLTADLGRIGIRVRPRAAPDTEVFRRVEEADTSLCLQNWMSTSGDAGLTYNYLIRSREGDFGTHNAGRFSDPLLDGLLKQVAREPVPRARQNLLHRVADLTREQMAVVPLYRKQDVYAARPGVRFRPRLDRQVRISDADW